MIAYGEEYGYTLNKLSYYLGEFVRSFPVVYWSLLFLGIYLVWNGQEKQYRTHAQAYYIALKAILSLLPAIRHPVQIVAHLLILLHVHHGLPGSRRNPLRGGKFSGKGQCDPSGRVWVSSVF